MKAKNKSQSCPITGPLLDDIEKQDKANFQAQLPDPSIGSAPLAQPDLYQDSGGGYNVDFVDPQD